MTFFKNFKAQNNLQAILYLMATEIFGFCQKMAGIGLGAWDLDRLVNLPRFVNFSQIKKTLFRSSNQFIFLVHFRRETVYILA